jgi:hypothetical protein
MGDKYITFVIFGVDYRAKILRCLINAFDQTRAINIGFSIPFFSHGLEIKCAIAGNGRVDLIRRQLTWPV